MDEETMRLDAHDLRIETNDQGFIIGSSLIGDVITDEASAWREVRTDFSNMTLTRTVSVDKGVLFRPEASQLKLRTPTEDYMNGVFGKSIRVFWKNQLLFQGEIRNATLSSQAEADGNKTYMVISAIDSVDKANSYILYNYSAPEETVQDRVADATAGTGIELVTINCLRPMAARASTNIKLMTVLQEASDAQLARFYSDRQGRLIMDGLRPGEPVITFSDNHAVPGHTEYSSLDMAESVVNTITGAFVSAKQDETMFAIKRHDSAVVMHEEQYEIDLPLVQENFEAWAESFPLLGYTRLEPSGLNTYWQDELIDLDLTELVTIQWKGKVYRSGIKGINMDIKPDHDNGLVWNVSLDLIPGHLIEFSSVIAPSPVNDFLAIGTTPSTVDLTWKRPSMPATMTGYMLRYADGPVAPATQNDGILLGVFPTTQTSYTLTNQPSRDQNSYSIWAVTDSPTVSSGVVTTTAITPEIIPSAPTSVVATKGHNAYQAGYVTQMWHDITWNVPTTMGDAEYWVVRYTTDGTTPTATTGTSASTFPIAGNTRKVRITYGTSSLNKTVKVGVFTKTYNGQYGPGTIITTDSNEQIPEASASTLTNVSMPGYSPRLVRIKWTKITETNPDFFVYRIEYNVNQTGPVTTPGTGTLVGEWTRESAATDAYTHDVWVAIGSNIKFTIFTKTYGGKYGYGWNSIQTPA